MSNNKKPNISEAGKKSYDKASKKSDDKEAADKKTTQKPAAKKPVAKKAAKRDCVEIVYLNRTPEAIAELRSDIAKHDPVEHLKDIDEDWKNLVVMMNRCVRPAYEDTKKWELIILVLQNRDKNAHKLLNKIVPDFKEEELSNIDVGENANSNPDASRNSAIAKLSQALKPVPKIRDIKNPKWWGANMA